jgi:hypothetical protein
MLLGRQLIGSQDSPNNLGIEAAAYQEHADSLHAVRIGDWQRSTAEVALQRRSGASLLGAGRRAPLGVSRNLHRLAALRGQQVVAQLLDRLAAHSMLT